MATTENVPITPGSGANIAADGIADKDATGATIWHQQVKLETGPEGSAYQVTYTQPIPTTSVPIERLLIGILVELRVLNYLTMSNVFPTEDLDALRAEEMINVGLPTDQEQ